MKKVTLTLACKDDEANHLAQLMCDDPINSEGFFTLSCGYIEDLTIEEEEYIRESLSPDFDKDEIDKMMK